MRCYSDLVLLPTIDERFRYLRQAQNVGEKTFGWSRYLNQAFYKSHEWKLIRDKIIVRDGGNDLGVDGYPVGDRGYVHHINPITIEQLRGADDAIFDPENLILCSFQTHNAIHYGTSTSLYKDLITRSPGDTCPWK